MENNNFYTISGKRIPKGTLPCWYVSNEDRVNAIQESKPFNDNLVCYFKITNRLDNNFIQGYLAHIDYMGKHFHEDAFVSYTYLKEYQERKAVYFSFDRVTLYRLIEIMSSKPLTFTLKRVDYPKSVVTNQAFIIMPFKFDELNEFYKIHIREYLKSELQINVLRADDFNDNDIIIETIYNQIERSEFIITETSHPNKNVFFEFGYAAAKDKEIITIQNADIEQSLFFDRAHIRAILYSINNIAEFQKQLKNTIVAVREKIASKN